MSAMFTSTSVAYSAYTQALLACPVAVQQVGFLLRVREIPTSCLATVSRYPGRGFWWFSSVPHVGIVPQIRSVQLPSSRSVITSTWWEGLVLPMIPRAIPAGA
jgi:hypothetical protein